MLAIIDGNVHDVLTIGISAVYSIGMSARVKVRKSERFAASLSYGLSLYPLMLVACTAFSTAAAPALLSTNKVLMSLAGITAFIVTLKRTFEE